MNKNVEYYDQLETRDPQTRREAKFAALPEQINHAQRRSRAFARILADLDSVSITTADALAQLPVTRFMDPLPLFDRQGRQNLGAHDSE